MLIPAALALLALGAYALWLHLGPGAPMAKRVPGTDHDPGSETWARANPVLAGKLLRSEGQPANLPGAWPQFRGPQRDAISAEAVSLERSWAPGQPRELWAIDVGEGYAGPVILNGRVYLMDYDRDQQQDALRCLSLADGREIWRYSYPVRVKRNHGMSRTVGGVIPGINAFAAPVFDHEGKMALALAGLGPVGLVPPHWNGALPKAIRAAALAVSRELGWRGSPANKP